MYWRIKKEDRIYLNVGFIHFHEEVFDTVFIFNVMQQNEAHSGGGHKRRDKPLIEFVHNLKSKIWDNKH